MKIINDYAQTGTRYYMADREKRNVTDWAQRVDRLELRAYQDPAHHVFRTETERPTGGEIIEITRIVCGRRGEERTMFEVHRNAEAVERRREAFAAVNMSGERI